ncbi:serine protease HTRA3-like isoform X2 [Oppia nitens]|uniref:serine protease HTRA3-like isoform X2 n=1 Tax=Oppia nitens TaxID=1686743 RepID=UPI0023DBE6BA|nr:serine protease HTRA3-like isoform X2 [Oppia nitens]
MIFYYTERRQVGLEMLNQQNKANNTNKPWIEWLSRAHMKFEVDLKKLKQDYKFSVIVLMGVIYEDNESIETIGTGLIIDNNRNLAITNAHVVAGYNFMFAQTCFMAKTVQLAEQSTVETTCMTIARVVYSEDNLDLAIVQLAELRACQQLPIMWPKFCPPELGEPVVILGNGEQQYWTIYVGYVNVIHPLAYQSVIESNKSQLFVVHNSNVTPGTSGSPIINANYDIIGINFAEIDMTDKSKLGTHSQCTVEFIQRAMKYDQSMDRLNEKHNRFIYYTEFLYNKLGIILAKTTDINKTGFVVIDIIDNRRFKLQINDIIVKVNGQPFADISQITDAINRSEGNIDLMVNRNENILPVKASRLIDILSPTMF